MGQQVLIVAGICLPILILLGLKGGHVANLRKSLVTSASGRKILVFAKPGEVLTAGALRDVRSGLAMVDFAVPELKLTVTLENKRSEGEVKSATLVGLQTTDPDDPELGQLGIGIPHGDECGIVLTHEIAERLGAAKGDSITITCQRRALGEFESASVDVRIWGVLERPLDKERSCYATVALMNQIDSFIRGNRVAERGWPATRQTAKDEYAAFLIFCRQVRDLSPEDRRYLTEVKSLHVEAVEDASIRTLYGLLDSKQVGSLRTYIVYSDASRNDPTRRLNVTAKELQGKLVDSDAVVLPWNEPWIVSINEVKHRLVGYSPSQRSWLENYLVDPTVAFPGRSFRKAICVPTASPLYGRGHADLMVNGQLTFAVEVVNQVGMVPPLVLDVQPPDSVPTDAKPMESDKPLSAPTSPAAEGESRVLGPAVPQAAPGSAEPKKPTPHPGEEKRTTPTPTELISAVPLEILASDAADPTLQLAETKPAVIGENRSRSDPPSVSVPAGNEAVQATDMPIAASEQSTLRVQNNTRPSMNEISESSVTQAAAGEPLSCSAPSSLLAHIVAFEAKTVDFDPAIDTFVPLPTPVPYPSLRMYARTIDDVPAAIHGLAELGYKNTISEETRIREIVSQDKSLASLVWIVAAAVFTFGVLTVTSVLQDATARARRTIGILRVMGVSQSGIFFVILGRATVVGLTAAIVAVAVAMAGKPMLAQWSVEMQFSLMEFGEVIVTTVVCCIIGALFPSWFAARLDPFENVVQGKFH